MKYQYYLLYYRFHQKDRYLIWIMGNGEEDRFYVDSKSQKIPIFSKLKYLKRYAKKYKIKIEPMKPILHDLDSVSYWLQHTTKDLDCDTILTAWNFLLI